jgi:transposase
MSLWSHFTTDGACFSTMALLPGSQPRCAIRGDFASPRPLLRGTEKLEEARACFEQALLLRKSKGDQRGIISTQRALDVLRTSQLDERLHRVRVSQIRELQEFAAGVERDKAAVAAELTLVQNNGVVEDHVNKLKLMKRMG